MDKAFYDRLVEETTKLIPRFRVRFKEESWTQKILSWILFFNKGYMTRFTTTLYPTVWFPKRAEVEANPDWASRVLMHELVHLWDRKRRGYFVFNVAYLFPQIFALGALGALGAIFALWHLWFLGFLIFLLPWPSVGRTQIEVRGFTMNLALPYWRTGSLSPTKKAEIIPNFTGWNYYRMCPSQETIERKLTLVEESIKNGSVLLGPDAVPYRLVYGLLKEGGYVH